MFTMRWLVVGLAAALPLLHAQETADPKQKIRTARQLTRQGSTAIPQLAPFLGDSSRDVRLEAVKAITEIGTQYSLDPLIKATHDNDPEVQMRAVEGLVNFYYPGYIQGRFDRMGTVIRSRWTDTNDQVIPAYVQVRADVIDAISPLVRGGASMASRAAAARAIGVLRGRAAIPNLLAAMRTKDDDVMYESILALQKIGDASVAQNVSVYLRDLTDKVQLPAIETVALLHYKPALPELQKIYASPRNDRVRRAALTAMAMLPDESSRSIYTAALNDKDESIRAAAAEGFARLKALRDVPALERAFNEEKKMGARLAMAFALVNLGKTELGEFAPFQYLLNTLNSRQSRGISEAYLRELAREAMVREQIYAVLPHATKDEKVGIARVLAASGDQKSMAKLEQLSKDADQDVAEEGVRAVRTLRARIM